MNELTIREISTKKDFHRFLQFPYDLFKDDKMWVPPLILDEKTTFDKRKNPALEFCEYKIFMAYRGDKAVGRIVGIINTKSNSIWKEKRIRFGWFDFVDDNAVCKILLDAVAEWGKSKGMEEIVGPMGFTDMDKEGMIVEGFDVDCPMACYYNPSYYPKHMDMLSYRKETNCVIDIRAILSCQRQSQSMMLTTS